MKRLYIVRHAKSSWKDESLTDFNRPLKGRGILNALEIAEQLKADWHIPEEIYVSAAKRTLETATIFTQVFNQKQTTLHVMSDLYECNGAEVKELVCNLPNKLQSVMVIGHEPSLSQFFKEFVEFKHEKFVTSGVVCLDFDTKNWSGINRQNAQLLFYNFPQQRNRTV